MNVLVFLLADEDGVPQMEVNENHDLVLAGLVEGVLDVAAQKKKNEVKVNKK